MSATFLIVFLGALVLVVFWRAALMIIMALVLTVVVTGLVDLGGLVDESAGSTRVVAPAVPDNRAQQPSTGPVEPPR